MKTKIMFLLFILFGIYIVPNTVFADEYVTKCYYQANNNNFWFGISGSSASNLSHSTEKNQVQQIRGVELFAKNGWFGTSIADGSFSTNVLGLSKGDFKNWNDIKGSIVANNYKCPAYVVLASTKPGFTNHWVYVYLYNTEEEANKAKEVLAPVQNLIGISPCTTDTLYNKNQPKPDETKFGSMKCESIFGTYENGKYKEETMGWFLQMIFDWMKILGPILVLLLSGFDYAKIALLGDDERMKKANSKLFIRIVAALGLFLVPAIINVIIGVLGANTGTCGIK